MTTPKIRTPRGRLSHLQAAAGADAWTSKERILLIETVMQLGTDDWSGISKAMHEYTKANRTKEWCSPHNCTREYQVAVESATKIVRHRGFTGGGADLLMQIRNYYIEDRINKLKVEEAEQRKRYLDLLKFQQEVDEGQHEEKLDDLYDAYEAAGVTIPEGEDNSPVNYGALSELAAMSGRMSMILSIINQVIGRTPEVTEEAMETSEMKPETPSAGLGVEDDDFNDLLACLPNVGAFDDDIDPSMIDDTNLFQSPPDSSRRSTGISPKGSPQKRPLGTTPTDDDRLRSMPPPSSAPTLSLLLGMPPSEPGQPLPEIGSVAKVAESITAATLQGRSPSQGGYSTPPYASPSSRESPTKLSSSPTLQRLLEGTMFKKDSTEGNALEEMAVQAIVSGAAETKETETAHAPAVKEQATAMEIEVKVTATVLSTKPSDLETSAASEPMDILEPAAVEIQDVTDAPISAPVEPVVQEIRARSSPRKAKLTEIVRSDSIPELEINNKPVSPVQSSHSPRKTLPLRVEIPPTAESKTVKEEIMSPRKPEPIAKTAETESKKAAEKEEERMDISESEQDVKPEVESEDELRVTKPELTYSKKDLSGDSHEQGDSEESDGETLEKPEETTKRLMSPRTRSPANVSVVSPSKRGRKPKAESVVPANETTEEERLTRARRSQHSSPAPVSKTPKTIPKAEEEPSKDASKPTRSTRSRISVTPTPTSTSTSTPGPDVKPALPAPKLEKEPASILDIEPPSARLNRNRVSSVSRHDLSHLESNPSSPSSTTTTSTTMDDDKEYKVFKKSIVFLWEQIKTHKHAGQFLKPITDASVPTYSKKVLRPMDLSTLKRSIDHGQIRTVQAFEREIYLMFMNAIMYNTYSHEIHQRTLEMESDVRVLIDQYKAAQKTLKGGSAHGGDAADGNTSLTRSPVKLRNRSSMRRSIKKSESEHDETGIDSGTHTPISMTDTEFDDGDSDRLGRKTRDNSPDVTHHAPRRGRPPLKRNLDRTFSTDATHAPSEASTSKHSD